MTTRHRRLGAGRPAERRRPRRRRYLVVTNGEVTEPEYFHGLQTELDNVVLEVRHFRRDPSALASVAGDLKRSESASAVSKGADDFAGVFAVTDVDDFPPEQFRRARRVCKEAGVELIVSNPCFEVWLIDHFVTCADAYALTRDVERKAAELGLTGGERNKHVVYDRLRGKHELACVNAARHNTEERRFSRRSFGNLAFAPWTDMPDLMARLKER